MGKTEICFVSELSDNQVDQLVKLYQNEFWCKNRTRPDVDKMLNHTDIVIGVTNREEGLIGFVRVLTDYTYKATIFDLIVHRDWRNEDIGRALMNAVIHHPDLQAVEHIDLNCLPAMFSFYEKWDFTADLDGLGFMRRFNHPPRVQ